jgi:serine/threonine protein kinase/tetratricopeptide (TPR) repeat protein
VNEEIRIGLSFLTRAEFVKSCGKADGMVFVPYPDELSEKQMIALDVFVSNDARLELMADVVHADFDESGNTGVKVKLSIESRAAIKRISEQLSTGLRSLYETARIGKPAPLNADGIAEVLFEPGTVIDERFRIEAHIASGGMGHVYRATHVHLNRLVALKLMKRAMATDNEMWGRFKREAELVSQLESQFVVRVFDFGTTKDGQPFLAMEYVEGQTLEGVLSQGPVALDLVVQIIREVGAGLSEAHALGVIHRDLKPANIMMGKRRDGTSIAKILDFGIARLADGAAAAPGAKNRLTQLGLVIGTPAYLSPEQAMADHLDTRTDIYALGCVVYELLTGAPPFSADTAQKMVSLHLTQVPDDPADRRPDLATFPKLSRVVLKALEKEREKRFKTVLDFVEGIEGALGLGPDTEPDSPEELWPAQAPNVAAVSNAVAAAAVDDFFGGESSSGVASAASKFVGVVAPVSSASTLARASIPLRGVLSDKVCDEMAGHQVEANSREKWAGSYIEILGPALHSDQWRRALVILGERMVAAGGFLVSSDDDGCVAAFAASKRRPSVRAAMALASARDIMSEEGIQATPSFSVTLRASLIPIEKNVAHNSSELQQARQLVARAKPGGIVCLPQMQSELRDLFELQPTEDSKGVVIGARRVHLKRSQGETIGRSALLESLERRLQSLQQGVVAPLLIRGPRGSGRTLLSNELIARARKRSCVVASTSGVLSSSAFSAITDMICSLVGLTFEHRKKLKPELVKLKLGDALVEAAMVVTGNSALPISATPGQAALVLRTILRAGAAERPVVLVFDGLEHFDAQSIETFCELLAVPASRELCVGFASTELQSERLSRASASELQPLSRTELESVLLMHVDVKLGPVLLEQLLLKEQPAIMLSELARLEDAGVLGFEMGAYELVDEAPKLSRDKLASWPGECVNLFEAIHACGESFDGQSLATAHPRTNAAVLQRLATIGVVKPRGVRRWGLSEKNIAEQLEQHHSLIAPGMHLRLAHALVEQGRTQQGSVEPSVVARHFLLGGDGLRASQLLKHLVETAMAQRQFRDASLAARDFSRALGLIPNGGHLIHSRLDALARGAGMALVMQDATLARNLVDEGLLLAERASPTAELLLSAARVSRSEARRSKAAQLLGEAEKLAGNSPVSTLILVERSEVREIEGDIAGAKKALELALQTSDAANELANWHGELNLKARVKARLGSLCLQDKEYANAQLYLEAALQLYRTSQWPFAQSRVLMNLGTLAIFTHKPADAAIRFGLASAAASQSGDVLFQARALLAQAKALKKVPEQVAALKVVLAEVRTMAMAIGWQQGRDEAQALFAGV